MLAINYDPESAFFPIIIMQTEIGESGRFSFMQEKESGVHLFINYSLCKSIGSRAQLLCNSTSWN